MKRIFYLFLVLVFLGLTGCKKKEKSFRELERELSSGDWLSRQFAARELRTLRKESFSSLLSFLQQANSAGKIELIKLLSSFARDEELKAEAFSALFQLSRDRDPIVRARAAEALRHFDTLKSESKKLAVSTILGAVKDERDPRIKGLFLQSLAHFSPDAPQLFQILQKYTRSRAPQLAVKAGFTLYCTVSASNSLSDEQKLSYLREGLNAIYRVAANSKERWNRVIALNTLLESCPKNGNGIPLIEGLFSSPDRFKKSIQLLTDLLLQLIVDGDEVSAYNSKKVLGHFGELGIRAIFRELKKNRSSRQRESLLLSLLFFKEQLRDTIVNYLNNRYRAVQGEQRVVKFVLAQLQKHD